MSVEIKNDCQCFKASMTKITNRLNSWVATEFASKFNTTFDNVSKYVIFTLPVNTDEEKYGYTLEVDSIEIQYNNNNKKTRKLISIDRLSEIYDCDLLFIINVNKHGVNKGNKPRALICEKQSKQFDKGKDVITYYPYKIALPNTKIYNLFKQYVCVMTRRIIDIK